MGTRRHMSMLRSYTAADAFTIGNAACGTIAIFLCLDYLAERNARFLWAAFLLLPLALVLDVLDGYVARLNQSRTPPRPDASHSTTRSNPSGSTSSSATTAPAVPAGR